jgi:hypothetical protein
MIWCVNAGWFEKAKYYPYSYHILLLIIVKRWPACGDGMISGEKSATQPLGVARTVALGLALLLPLAGCMASGASSFSDPADAIDEMQEIPLDIATVDSDDPFLSPAPDSTAGIEADGSGVYGVPTAAEPLAAVSLLPEEQIADEIMSKPKIESEEVATLRRETEARMAALAARHPDAASDLLLPEGEEDPEEVAARMRIPALFASIDHGQCKGGWGPKPKMVNARRVDPNHEYYMEMRMRHTPLLPVGHVYIAYGRLGPFGEPLDEKLTMLSPLGGYVGAGIASTVPMPGILKPVGSDCTVVPEAAYRVSLSAQDYETLLLAIKEQQAKKPAYHLFAYNCNHYLSDVAASVGILPPENIYQPSLTYLYALMDRNEGHKVKRTPMGWNVASRN